MFERNHKPLWTEEEKRIVKENLELNVLELSKLLPDRSLSAIKNRVKREKIWEISSTYEKKILKSILYMI